MARIVVSAENFAFGPIGTLLTIVEPLHDSGHEVIYIGEGTAYQLGRMAGFEKVINFNTESEEFPKFAKDIFASSDLLITAVDRPSTLLAQKIGIPVAWIDMLFWWWDDIPEYLWNVDMYFYQRSLNEERNLVRYGDKIKNLIPVGPLVDMSASGQPKKKSQLLITYGGMEAEGWYNVGVDTFYPYILTELIIKYCDLSNFEKVLFAGNRRIIEELKQKYGNNKLIFETIPHKEFLKTIASSEVVLMVPGLQTPLEAFSYGVPVIFLPPSNSSQYVQLDEFRERGIAPMSVHFADYLPKLHLAGRNLREIMTEFLEQLHEFEKRKDIQEKMGLRISQYLNDRSLWEKSKSAEKKFVMTLGGNGVQSIVEKIGKFLEERSL